MEGVVEHDHGGAAGRDARDLDGVLDRPRDQVAHALHALAQHVVGHAEGVDHRHAAHEHLEQAVILPGTTMSVSRLGAPPVPMISRDVKVVPAR